MDASDEDDAYPPTSPCSCCSDTSECSCGDEDDDDDEEQRPNRWTRPPDPEGYINVYPVKLIKDGVTNTYKCQPREVKGLYIFDNICNLPYDDEHDIGGVYTDDDPVLWFFYTTTRGPGEIHLMNIFMCHKKPGLVALGISNSSTLRRANCRKNNVQTLSNELRWKKYKSSQPNEVHHVITYNFSKDDCSSLSNSILFIPLSIDLSPKCMLNDDLVQKIKSEHDFGENLLKDQVPDFVLRSSTEKEYKVHKIVLAAHSPVIKESIRPKDCNSLSLNLPDEEMELLLQYLYSGTIKDILNQNFENLLAIANKFQLNNLTELVKYAIKVSTINSKTALPIAALSETYNFEDIQELAFEYIATHPEVLESDTFSEINNATLVKKLLMYIHVPTHRK